MKLHAYILARLRRGFSLVEILVSILILALGVLGLGALFPAVIRQQRMGTDSLNGMIAAQVARSTLIGTSWNSALDPKIAQPPPPTANSSATPKPPPDMWSYIRQGQNTLFPRLSPDPTSPFARYQSGDWFVAPVVANTGQLFLGNPTSLGGTGGVNGVPVDVTFRLYPSVSEGDPQYVWDVAFQLDPNDPRNHVVPDLAAVPATWPKGRLRAAVFVRRIDNGIRVPPNSSLAELIYTRQRLPVGEMRDGTPTYDGTAGDSSGGGSSGTPTLRYSPIKTTTMVFIGPNGMQYKGRDRLYFPQLVGGGGGAGHTPATDIQQAGQKVVDNLGNVYTVTGFDSDNDGNYITIDPPVPSNVTQDRASASASQVPNSKNQAIFSVAYTSQPPVSLIVVEIDP